MLGVLATLLVAKGAVGIGTALLRRWSGSFDTALRFGLAGLTGLGVLGTLTFFLGLIPGGLGWGVWLVALYGLAGLVLIAREKPYRQLRLPKGPVLIALLVLVVVGLFGLVSVLAPSTADDWDTLAYHLAVPKLWLRAGHIFSVPSLHQSNFPDVIDDLYAWGLQWGGEAGAKTFSLAFYLLGMAATFGFARQRYGEKAGWWSAIAFATVPALMWESGTGYIDLGHGVFAGMGIALAAASLASEEAERRNWLVACGVMLGFAAASKYTGLQTIFVVAVLLGGWEAFERRHKHPAAPRGKGEGDIDVATRGLNWAGAVRSAGLVALVSLAIASPWYIKNLVTLGNPVYPFLYEHLGGKNWDQRRADIYRIEQQDFGVGLKPSGGRDPVDLGHAVLGLEYQPGRYVNPGETIGLGSPSGAIGIAVLGGLLLWPIFGLRRRPFEGFVAASALLSFLVWFFLSQQSRYVTTLAPPGAILLGGAVADLPVGIFAAVLASIQAAYSLWYFQTTRFASQIQVDLGRVSAESYQSHSIPFYDAAQVINRTVPATGKVALYDEVFGYLLNVPYMWANPGHSTIIPYDTIRNGDGYVAAMKKLGFTHVYLNLSPHEHEAGFTEWLAALGASGSATSMPMDITNAKMSDWQTKWEALVADAVVAGKLRSVQSIHAGILFEIQ